MHHQKKRDSMPNPNFFTAGSPYLDHPLLTPERTAQEIDFVLSETGIPPGGRILDVGCGPGRHSIELAQRGYNVLGIDSAAAMITAARSRASEAEVSPKFQQAAGEDFASNQPFDAAICLFTTLGQLGNDNEDRKLVARVASNLKTDGFLVVEVPQRDWVAENLNPADRFGEVDRYTDIVRQLNAEENTVTEVFTLVSPEETRQYVLRYRLYSPVELNALLDGAGFKVVSIYGGYDKVPLSPESPVIVTVAQRKGRADR